MRKQALVNKAAWEHRAYDFWNQGGSPEERAAQVKADPRARLGFHKGYFEDVAGKRIANPCGSNGRRAIPLALLGADVTVFDLSGENRRYALEVADAAGVRMEYVLGDFCEADLNKYADVFDIVYAEGGVIHYFSDIAAFANTLYAIIKPAGRLILSDFHPYRKTIGTGSAAPTDGDYFDARLHSVNVPYRGFFSQAEQDAFPQCLLRFYTLGEIVNAVIAVGFVLDELAEHPSFENGKLPGAFTIIAHRRG